MSRSLIGIIEINNKLIFFIVFYFNPQSHCMSR